VVAARYNSTMNTRNVVGGFIALVALAIVAYIRFGYSGDAVAESIERYSRETRQEFLASIDTTSVMRGPDRPYVERLAEENHERAWADNHRIEHPAGAQVECIVNIDGYARDLLQYMAAAAQADNPALAEELLTIRSHQFSLE